MTRFLIALYAATVATVGAAHANPAAPCPWIEPLNAARVAQNPDALVAAIGRATADPLCRAAEVEPFRVRAANLYAHRAGTALVAGDNGTARMWATRALGVSGVWPAYMILGDIAAGEKRWGAAFDAYSAAVNALHDLGPDRAEERTRNLTLATAKLEEAMVLGAQTQYLRAATTKSGAPGGVFHPETYKSPRPRSTPLPITFETASTALTAQGQAYITDLVGLIERVGPTLVIIEGHADARGTDAYNLDLSRRRAEAVAAAVRQALASRGLSVPRFEIEGFGEAQPFESAREDLTQEEQWALDRRVAFKFEGRQDQ